MARPNIKGTSFSNLGLEKHEDKKLKAVLKEKDITAKQFLRFLVRQHLKTWRYSKTNGDAV